MEVLKDARIVFPLLTYLTTFFSLFPLCVAVGQVEKWNRRDQKLLDAVQRGDVGRVAALASRKSARPTKLDPSGQSP